MELKSSTSPDFIHLLVILYNSRFITVTVTYTCIHSYIINIIYELNVSPSPILLDLEMYQVAQNRILGV
jgi:hypothetical protein